MGVSLDTFDKVGGIHPRNKQLPSFRLATAGLNVAYGLTSYPSNGPFPEAWNLAHIENDLIQVDISYDKSFTWNPVESEGFYVCRLDGGIDKCNSRGGAWEKVSGLSKTTRTRGMVKCPLLTT